MLPIFKYPLIAWIRVDFKKNEGLSACKETFAIPWHHWMLAKTWPHLAPRALVMGSKLTLIGAMVNKWWLFFIRTGETGSLTDGKGQTGWGFHSFCNNDVIFGTFCNHWRHIVQYVQLYVPPITHCKMDVFVTTTHNNGTKCLTSGPFLKRLQWGNFGAKICLFWTNLSQCMKMVTTSRTATGQQRSTTG